MSEFIHRNDAGRVLAEKSRPVEYVPAQCGSTPSWIVVDAEVVGVSSGCGALTPSSVVYTVRRA